MPGKVIEVVKTSPAGKYTVHVVDPFTIKGSGLTKTEADQLAKGLKQGHMRLGLVSTISYVN